jgi:hypothetical protein
MELIWKFKSRKIDRSIRNAPGVAWLGPDMQPLRLRTYQPVVIGICIMYGVMLQSNKVLKVPRHCGAGSAASMCRRMRKSSRLGRTIPEKTTHTIVAGSVGVPFSGFAAGRTR